MVGWEAAEPCVTGMAVAVAQGASLEDSTDQFGTMRCLPLLLLRLVMKPSTQEVLLEPVDLEVHP